MARPKMKSSTTKKKNRMKKATVSATKKTASRGKRKATAKKSGRASYQVLIQTVIKNRDALQKAANKEVTAQTKQMERLTSQLKKASNRKGKKASPMKALEKKWKGVSERLAEAQYMEHCIQAVAKALSNVKAPKPEKMPVFEMAPKEAPLKTGSENKTKPQSNVAKNMPHDPFSSLNAPKPSQRDTTFPFPSDRFDRENPL